MPIYGFECDACGHQFDRLQKLSDPDPTSCPQCHAHALRRQLTAPAFRLSGSGWYETDFKKEGDVKRNLADKPGGEGKGEAAKADGATKPDVKSDAKPEAKQASTGTESAAKPAAKAESKPASPAPAP